MSPYNMSQPILEENPEIKAVVKQFVPGTSGQTSRTGCRIKDDQRSQPHLAEAPGLGIR